MDKRTLGLHGQLLAAALALLLAACGGGGDGSASEPPAAVARIEVTPAAALLPAAGASAAFRAQAYDAAGRALDVPVAWSSSRPAQVEVDGTGRATALVAAGSAQISASAGGVRSAPVLAWAATPAAGVGLVADEQLVGDAVDSDAGAPPGDGNTYEVTLVSGSPVPAVGSRLLGTGAKALAGRVKAVTPLGADGLQTRLTMELLPLNELVQALSIDERFELSHEQAVLAPEVLAQFAVERTGMRWRFTPRPAATSSGTKRATSVVGTHAADILPFRDCESSLAGDPLSLESPSIGITIDPRVELRVDSVRGLERLVVQAEPDVELGLTLKASSVLGGSVSCKLQLLAFRLPIAGPLAFFIGGLVPVGVGFDFEATTQLTQFSVGANARAFGTARAGIECLAAAGCGFVRSIDDSGTSLEPRLELPTPPANLRLASKLHAFGYFEAELGNPLLRSLRFKGFEARIGGELAGRFAPPVVQLLDEGFSAGYEASLRGRAQLGTGIGNIVRLLSLGAVTEVALAFEQVLARSPRVISVPADRASFAAGDTVNVSVLLDPATLRFLPGVDNVESVQLRRRVGDATEVVASLPAAAGQDRFEFSVVAPHAGDVSEWVAFVTTRLLPAEGLGLELARAAAASADVMLLQASAGSVAYCNAQAREYDYTLDPFRNPRDASDLKPEGEANPAECRAQAWDAVATSSGFGQGAGPSQDSVAAPTPVSSLAGSSSAVANATSTPWIEEPSRVRTAQAYGYASGGGYWVLRVEGRPVTMSMSGTLAGYASFRASWTAAGAGVAGSYVRDPFPLNGGVGPFAHSVRLEPGQSVTVRFIAQAIALSPAAPPSPSTPFQPGPDGGTASVAVSFTPL